MNIELKTWKRLNNNIIKPMKNILIRRTEKQDLNGIYNLYSGKKSLSEIDWVLRDYDNGGYRSYVAINNNETVAGHIGYCKAEYYYNGKIYNGLHNMMWIVNPKVKGGVGLKLIAKNISDVDFGFAIGASKFTKKLFPLIKYKYQFSVPQYYKFIVPMVSQIKRRMDEYESSVSLEQVNDRNIDKVEYIQYPNVFFNTQNPAHLKWLLECPLNDSFLFNVLNDGKKIGIAVCYIKNRMNILKTGRIIHISFLGYDKKVWLDVIKELNNFFILKNCAVIFVPAQHYCYREALEKLNFKKHSRFAKPFYLYNEQAKLPNIEQNNYHFTFWESDLGYRNF